MNPEGQQTTPPRPGLGTRTDDDGMKPVKTGANRPTPHDDEPLGRNAPLPPDTAKKRSPQEQEADLFAQQQERSTGVSGHSSST
jgi:hypothetical protein